MSRTTARARKPSGSSRESLEPAGAVTALVHAWWASLLAGELDQPHPVYGSVRAHLDGGHLRLSGEVETEADRSER